MRTLTVRRIICSLLDHEQIISPRTYKYETLPSSMHEFFQEAVAEGARERSRGMPWRPRRPHFLKDGQRSRDSHPTCSAPSPSLSPFLPLLPFSPPPSLFFCITGAHHHAQHEGDAHLKEGREIRRPAPQGIISLPFKSLLISLLLNLRVLN